MTILENLCRDAAEQLSSPVAWIGLVEAGGERIVAVSGSRRRSSPPNRRSPRASWTLATSW